MWVLALAYEASNTIQSGPLLLPSSWQQTNRRRFSPRFRSVPRGVALLYGETAGDRTRLKGLAE